MKDVRIVCAIKNAGGMCLLSAVVGGIFHVVPAAMAADVMKNSAQMMPAAKDEANNAQGRFERAKTETTQRIDEQQVGLNLQRRYQTPGSMDSEAHHMQNQAYRTQAKALKALERRHRGGDEHLDTRNYESSLRL